MKKVKWGIISTGNIAHSVARDFKYVENGKIEAVSSRSLASAKKFAEEFGIDKAYGSYEELYKDPDIDAIYIGTPHNFHFRNAAEALNAGKAVLCEKPITISESELNSLLDIAKSTNKYLMEAMWTYFLPAIIKAKNWLDSGEIGTLTYIKADFAFKADPLTNLRLYDPKLAGGALLDIGIYPIALACLVQNQLPIKISTTSKKADSGVDSEESMLFEYLDGTTASLMSSFLFDMPNDALLIGDKGYIRIPDFYKAKECYLYKYNELADSFIDEVTNAGYSHEFNAVNSDLIAGKTQSDVMPWTKSIMLQQIMNIVKDDF